MTQGKDFAVIQLTDLRWPTSLQLPSKRFRLFVAADVSTANGDELSEFASAALRSGMIYFCSWGRDCERFHDIVDEVVVGDDLGDRRFAGPTSDDVVMTTWHDRETLEEALDFFATCALPTVGFRPDSSFRLVMCLGNPDWTATAARSLQSATFFV